MCQKENYEAKLSPNFTESSITHNQMYLTQACQMASAWPVLLSQTKTRGAGGQTVLQYEAYTHTIIRLEAERPG